MPVTKFGFSQFWNQTPMWATWVFRVVLYLCVIAIVFVNTYTSLPANLKQIISIYAAQTIAFVHLITKMFGLTMPNISGDPTNNSPSKN